MAEHFRPNIRVLIRIAKAYEQDASIIKTHLQSISRTDWDSFEVYIHWLLDRNYVTHKIDGKVHHYQITSIGKEMLNAILDLD
jgi:predicted transcriptional regulator